MCFADSGKMGLECKENVSTPTPKVVEGVDATGASDDSIPIRFLAKRTGAIAPGDAEQGPNASRPDRSDER